MEDMEYRDFPRVMIAAPGSGQGKTMITCGLLSLLQSAGMEVRAFKCGPDYIDPMFHRKVLGIPSYNLDSFFSDRNTLSYLLGRHGDELGRRGDEFGRHGNEIAVGSNKIGILEGVMGYYDGLGGITDKASSHEVAVITKTPVILVVDASGSSLSVLAALKGFLRFRRNSRICGVIFNRLSPGLYPGLKELAEQKLGITVIGYVPKLKAISWESRHLGLIRPEEIDGFQQQVQELAEAIRPTIDLDALVTLAGTAEPISWRPFAFPFVRKKNQTAPVIAVAMDEAFCFYYQDNLELLERMGAELCYFSPLRDREIPRNSDGLYLGGGYPELFCKELSENKTMLKSIRKSLEAELPCIAECGGYLYLKEWLEDKDGVSWEMSGFLKGKAFYTGRLKRFGYLTLEAERDSFLGDIGSRFPAHEFHYWDCEENGDCFHAVKPVTGCNWDCGYADQQLYAGFPHLYFHSNIPYGFMRRAAEWDRSIPKMESNSMSESNQIKDCSSSEIPGQKTCLAKLLSEIRPADKASMETARKRWNSVAKPIGSLGLLEENIIKIAGISGRAFGISLRKSALVVMCADHGVVEEGVTQTGQEVTRIVAENFTRGKTSVTIMCGVAGTDVFPVDIGMVGDHYPDKKVHPFTLLDRKISPGSKNIVTGPAMEEDQCLKALLCGIDLVGELKRQGYEILATGEMGIGNTTPSSALVSVLSGLSPETVTGRGAGLSDEGLTKKQRAVSAAVERFYVSHPEFIKAAQAVPTTWDSLSSPSSRELILSLLSELGGYDIAGITGLFLGGAIHRIPVLIDGFISSVAALLAVRLCVTAKDFMLASHLSSEPAGRKIMEALGLPAPLDCGMHLGEGSGAVAFLPLLYMGADVYEKMSTFEDIQVETYVDYSAKGEAGE